MTNMFFFMTRCHCHCAGRCLAITNVVAIISITTAANITVFIMFNMSWSADNHIVVVHHHNS